MRSFSLIILFALLGLFAGCGGEKKPSTPLETYRTYTKAVKQKDTTTMKLLLSSESLKMHEQEAKVQNTTVDEIVKRETLFNEAQSSVEYRNEKIEGDRATIEIRNPSKNWEVVPFVFENDQWKIDKKGYADRILLEMEEKNRQMDEQINRERTNPTDPAASPAAEPAPQSDPNALADPTVPD